MGINFRKSINLGGGFKINLSKSGVGYSWGTKGYRVTKSANGSVKQTLSIPKTGIKFEQNVNKKTEQLNQQEFTEKHPINTYDTREIKNVDAEQLVSEGLEELLNLATKALNLYSKVSLVSFISLFLGFGFPILWLLTAICFAYGIYLKKNAVIELDYTFEDDQAAVTEERMRPLIKMSGSKKLWYISQTSKVTDKKYAAGASNTLKRNACKASKAIPFPFKSNAQAVSFKMGKETLLFLPDKLFIIKGNKIGALNYSDIKTSIYKQRFIENGVVPKDAQIVDYTWKYVNKSGDADKRFKNNTKIPICLYGKMDIQSDTGLNTSIMFSNNNLE